MTRRNRHLLRNERGSAAIEFAVAAPLLATLIWGVFQFGMLFEANAGVQHSLGQAARYATIYPTPSDTAIQAKITANKFGLGNGTWSAPVIADDTATNSKLITVSYSQPMDFLLFQGPQVTLTRSKRVYLSN